MAFGGALSNRLRRILGVQRAETISQVVIEIDVAGKPKEERGA
jgi:hypothetical protein